MASGHDGSRRVRKSAEVTSGQLVKLMYLSRPCLAVDWELRSRVRFVDNSLRENFSSEELSLRQMAMPPLGA